MIRRLFTAASMLAMVPVAAVLALLFWSHFSPSNVVGWHARISKSEIVLSWVRILPNDASYYRYDWAFAGCRVKRFGVCGYRSWTLGLKPIAAGTLFVVQAALSIAWWRVTRGNQRSAVGLLCPVCGYDLRATPNRCPECGSPVPAKS